MIHLLEDMGMNKTHEALREHYQWPNMKQEVEEYVRK
jgi:hypothetical protein